MCACVYSMCVHQESSSGIGFHFLPSPESLVCCCMCQASWTLSFWGLSHPWLPPPNRNPAIAENAVLLQESGIWMQSSDLLSKHVTNEQYPQLLPGTHDGSRWSQHVEVRISYLMEERRQVENGSRTESNRQGKRILSNLHELSLALGTLCTSFPWNQLDPTGEFWNQHV